MLRKVRILALTAALSLILVGLVSAQNGAIEGTVLGLDGKGVKGALIKIERTDVRGNYKVKTKKDGRFFHAGLPLGSYNVALEIDGKVVDRAAGVRVGSGNQTVDFDLAEIEKRQQAASSGAGPGKAALKAMSASERKAYEDALKKRQQQLGKNKNLNEAFNLGMEAKGRKEFDVAVTHLSRAVEIDPEQDVIWANLADSQGGLAGKKTGDERAKLYQDAIDSYEKALALNPLEASFFNNLGLLQVRAKQGDAGKASLQKAAELDPASAGKYFFNLGAVMINSGDNDGAIEAFHMATEKQPDYAEAHYQYGTALVGAAKYQEDGSVVAAPGTIEAFETYLKLSPDGPNAAGAQGMIQMLSSSVDTKYVNPDAKRKKRK